MYSVSVIMPVYNNEKTLERAIESILSQTMYGFELILVNDGSTDGSAQICDTYAKKEPLIVEVIHQEHLGRGVALNKGLFNSTGSYIYFADATDTFDKRLLQSNVKLAKEKEVDLVVFGFQSLVDEKTNDFESHLPRMPILLEKEAFRTHYRNFHHFYPYALFNKLYKREYLFKHRLRFPHISLREEAFFNMSVYRELDSVAFNRGIYCYRNKNEFPLNNQYQEHGYEIHLQLAKYLEAMIIYWEYEDEYVDLISEAYFKTVYFEIMNIHLPNSPLTDEQKAKRMDAILADETMQRNLQKMTHLRKKNPYKEGLLSYMLSGDGKGAIDYVIRKNSTKKVSPKLTRLVRKIFSKN